MQYVPYTCLAGKHDAMHMQQAEPERKEELHICKVANFTKKFYNL